MTVQALVPNNGYIDNHCLELAPDIIIIGTIQIVALLVLNYLSIMIIHHHSLDKHN